MSVENRPNLHVVKFTIAVIDYIQSSVRANTKGKEEYIKNRILSKVLVPMQDFIEIVNTQAEVLAEEYDKEEVATTG